MAGANELAPLRQAAQHSGHKAIKSREREGSALAVKEDAFLL